MTTANPFNETETAAPTEPTDEELFAEHTDGTAAPEATVEDPDVDTPDASAEDSAPAPEAEKAKPAKAASASTRPPVPEGYTTPVQYAKILTDVLHEEGLLDADKVIAPQVAYSYIKNSQGGKNPFPVHSVGGRDWLLELDKETGKPEKAIQWWRDKINRVAESKKNAAAKAAKKAAAPAAKEGTEAKAEETGPVEEAE